MALFEIDLNLIRILQHSNEIALDLHVVIFAAPVIEIILFSNVLEQMNIYPSRGTLKGTAHQDAQDDLSPIVLKECAIGGQIKSIFCRAALSGDTEGLLSRYQTTWEPPPEQLNDISPLRITKGHLLSLRDYVRLTLIGSLVAHLQL